MFFRCNLVQYRLGHEGRAIQEFVVVYDTK